MVLVCWLRSPVRLPPSGTEYGSPGAEATLRPEVPEEEQDREQAHTNKSRAQATFTWVRRRRKGRGRLKLYVPKLTTRRLTTPESEAARIPGPDSAENLGPAAGPGFCLAPGFPSRTGVPRGLGFHRGSGRRCAPTLARFQQHRVG